MNVDIAAVMKDFTLDGTSQILTGLLPSAIDPESHRHSEDRVYTIISGVFYVGLGDEFDADKLEAYPPGAVIFLPGNTSHFHWAKSGAYIAQVMTAIGPPGFEYVNSKDDAQNENSTR